MKTFESVVHRVVLRDKFGDPLPDAVDDVQIDGVRVAPRGTSNEQQTDRADTVITGLLLVLPTGSPMPSPADQYLVRGFWRGVEGEPFDGGPKGVLVNVAGGQG